MPAQRTVFEFVAKIATTRPRAVLFAAVVLAVAPLVGLAQVRFVSDYDSTLPSRSDLTQQIKAIQTEFGTRSTLAFLIKAETSSARVQAACALVDGLDEQAAFSRERIYGIGGTALKYVENENDAIVSYSLDEPCFDPDVDLAQVRKGLGPQAALVLPASGNLVLYADIDAISGQYGEILADVDTLITGTSDVTGAAITYTGQPAFLAQNDLYAKRIALFFPLIMALVLLLHWEALRSVQAVIVPIFTGLAATLLGLGVYGWARLPLDTYSVLAPILILAVGAGHSVQLLKRYMEEISRAVPIGDQATRAVQQLSVYRSVVALGPVLTLAVIGAATCLFSLEFLDVAALSRFGFLAGMGLVFALVLELSVVPAIRTLLSPPRPGPRFGSLSAFWDRPLRAIARQATVIRPATFALILVPVLAVLFAGIVQIKPSHSTSVYIDPDVMVQKTLADITRENVGPYVLDIVVDTGSDGNMFSPEALELTRALEESLASDPNVTAVLSPQTILGFLKCTFQNVDPCTVRSVNQTEEASQLWTILYSGGDSAGLIDPTEQKVRLRAFLKSDATDEIEAIVASLRAVANPADLTMTFGGTAATAKALADGIVRVSLEKAMLLTIAAFLIGGLVFRSLRMGLLFVIPTLLTILVNFAWLGWTGTTLNVATAAVATIAVGVGFDYLVYLVFRIREFREAGETPNAALYAGIVSAGGAAVCVGSAVAVGYAVLMFSPGYLVHHWIAALVPATMLASLAGALFVFPVLFRFVDPPLRLTDVAEPTVQ